MFASLIGLHHIKIRRENNFGAVIAPHMVNLQSPSATSVLCFIDNVVLNKVNINL